MYPPTHRSHGTMTDVSSPPLYASTTLFNFFLRVGGVVTAVSPSVATAALGAATQERRTCVVHELYLGSICVVRALFTIHIRRERKLHFDLGFADKIRESVALKTELGMRD